MKRISFAIIIVILIFITGCAGLFQKKPLSLHDITIAEIRHRIEQNNLKFHSMKANAEISVESPKVSFVANSYVIIKKPDSLLIKIKAPFGIGFGSVFMDRNQFLAYNSFDNSVYAGNLEKLELAQFLPVDLKLENIIQSFSGVHLLDFSDQDSLAIDRNKYLIIGIKNNQKSKYWIDPKRFVVTEFQLLDNKDELLIKLEYKQFEKKHNVVLPRLIQITHLRQKTRLTILYNSCKPNCQLSQKDFQMTIPEQAERIKL
ncbi:MAG: DUF4292 domain-containing protein [bacterium]|nr:MAG: DUF4292 domain-containing protein [bacterium]